MPRPIKPLVCSPDVARIIGAQPYAMPATARPQVAFEMMTQAAARIGADGHIAVLTHGCGAVWAWPVIEGARDTGAGM